MFNFLEIKKLLSTKDKIFWSLQILDSLKCEKIELPIYRNTNP